MHNFDDLRNLHEGFKQSLKEHSHLLLFSRYQLTALFELETAFYPDYHFCEGSWTIRCGSLLVTDLNGTWDEPYLALHKIKRHPKLGVMTVPRDASNYLVFRLDQEVLPETTP